jgi:hypothetical protein
MKSKGKKAAARRARPNAARATERPVLRRKNLILDQVKIDQAKAVLGTATETETITRALDAINDIAAFRRELDNGFDDLVGGGGFTDRFGTGADGD